MTYCSRLSIAFGVLIGVVVVDALLLRREHRLLCSNGRQPGEKCETGGGGYKCKARGEGIWTWCERVNGSYKCCESSKNWTKKCEDASAYCRLTKNLCGRRENFLMMKKMCAATCELCEVESFEQLVGLRREAQRVGNETQKCVFGPTSSGNFSQPRKCVFPREKMLTTTTTSEPPAPEDKESDRDEYEIFGEVVGEKASHVEEEPENATVVWRKSVTAAVETNQLLSNSASRRREQLPSEETATTEKLTTLSEKLEQEERNVSTVPPHKNNETDSFEMRKVKLEELMSSTKGSKSIPEMVTIEPGTFTLSLTKTLIRGTCYDEYLYCREFSSLCAHPAFSDVMSIHCSLTCNRCDEVAVDDRGTEECVDISTDCRKYVDMCKNERFARLLRDYCPKACGFCIAKCRDRHQNCLQFAKDGFCLDEIYTADERSYLCGDTCNFCE